MASNNTEVDYAGGKHGKPPRSRCQSIGRAIYNPQKKEFLGRTCSSWAKIGVFYLVFYSCLAGFFAIMLVGFFSTLSETEPTMTGMYSLIKNNPGMGYRPLENIETTLIKFNSSKVDTYRDKVFDILKYLRENGYIDKDNKTVSATAENQFDLNEIHPHCNINYTDIERSFGYAVGKPCVLLKINRVYGWKPEAYSNESDTAEVKKATGLDTLPTDSVAVSCEGENDGDIDILGTVKFFPEEGFATKFFPYENAEGYRGPLVFAQFAPVKPGVLVQIWCKIWAKNVKHHRNDKGGSVRFELLVDTMK